MSTKIEDDEVSEDKATWYTEKRGKWLINTSYLTACAFPTATLIDNKKVPRKYSSLMVMLAVLVAKYVEGKKEKFDKNKEEVSERVEELRLITELSGKLQEFIEEENRTDASLGELFEEFKGLPDNLQKEIYKATRLNLQDIFRLLIEAMPEGTDSRIKYENARKAMRHFLPTPSPLRTPPRTAESPSFFERIRKSSGSILGSSESMVYVVPEATTQELLPVQEIPEAFLELSNAFDGIFTPELFTNDKTPTSTPPSPSIASTSPPVSWV